MTSLALPNQAPSTLPQSTPTETFPFHTHPHYTFPPFYTLQPNHSTRTAQLTAWSALLTSYTQHHHLFRLSPRHPVFHNTSLNRRLQLEDVGVLFAFMRERGTALPVGSNTTQSKQRGWYGGRAGADASVPAEGEVGEVFVLWHSLEEWASKLQDSIEVTGQRGAVLTAYEMTEGEQSRGREWEGMPAEVFRRVVDVLVRRGRAATIGEEEGLGVKFF